MKQYILNLEWGKENPVKHVFHQTLPVSDIETIVMRNWISVVMSSDIGIFHSAFITFRAWIMIWASVCSTNNRDYSIEYVSSSLSHEFSCMRNALGLCNLSVQVFNNMIVFFITETHYDASMMIMTYCLLLLNCDVCWVTANTGHRAGACNATHAIKACYMATER